MQEAEITDQEITNRMRETAKELNRLINLARVKGLTVTTNLNSIGQKNWDGYIDSIQVSRKF